jgi:hypothetical protein
MCLAWVARHSRPPGLAAGFDTGAWPGSIPEGIPAEWAIRRTAEVRRSRPEGRDLTRGE